MLLCMHRWWRGSTTGGDRGLDHWPNLPRSKLCNISKHEPDLLDAKYVACAQCEPGVWEQITQVLETDPSGYPSVEKQAQHKFLVDLDGEGYSGRFHLHLGMGSVYLKVATEYPTQVLDIASPYVHYLPVRSDMSDLISQIQYAREHDAEMQSIAAAAKDLFVALVSTGWQQHLHALLETYHSLFLP